MINDLDVQSLGMSMWKYVDDTTIAEVIRKKEPSKLQATVDEVAKQVAQNKFQLNETKCKELRVSFSRSELELDPILINDQKLERVEDAKILGLRFSSILKWNNHLSDIIKKVKSRLYFVSQLKRSGVKEKELLLLYLTCIRPVAEYACPVYHNSLPQYLHNDLERCQKRALRIVFPNFSYQEALKKVGLSKLFDRRENIVLKLFREVCSNPSHKLHQLLPPVNGCKYDLRGKRTFSVRRLVTERTLNSFIFKKSFSSVCCSKSCMEYILDMHSYFRVLLLNISCYSFSILIPIFIFFHNCGNASKRNSAYGCKVFTNKVSICISGMGKELTLTSLKVFGWENASVC